jgi:hypothetical protein
MIGEDQSTFLKLVELNAKSLESRRDSDCNMAGSKKKLKVEAAEESCGRKSEQARQRGSVPRPFIFVVTVLTPATT